MSDIRLSAAGTSFTRTAGATSRRLTTPLIGAFQAHNASVALAMLEAAGPRWARIVDGAPAGLAHVRLAGRFHQSGRWLFDVAHNADGAATVVANLRATGLPHPVVAVVTVLKDKDWQGILLAVGAVADRIIVTTAPTAPASRAWSLDEVTGWAREADLPVLRIDDFDAALREAEASGATILVTGSFHTVGDAMERLQVDPLAR